MVDPDALADEAVRLASSKRRVGASNDPRVAELLTLGEYNVDQLIAARKVLAGRGLTMRDPALVLLDTSLRFCRSREAIALRRLGGLVALPMCALMAVAWLLGLSEWVEVSMIVVGLSATVMLEAVSRSRGGAAHLAFLRRERRKRSSDERSWGD